VIFPKSKSIYAYIICCFKNLIDNEYFRNITDNEYFITQKDIETKLSAIGGSRLQHHNIDHLLDFNNLNLDQQIDLLIMQGGSAEVTTKENQNKISKFL